MHTTIFLDFDDVLCISKEFNSVQVMMCVRNAQEDGWPELWQNLVDPRAAANLRALHDEFAPQYVISSSWASYLERQQIVDVLTRTELDFVRDCLHACWRTPRGPGMTRAAEIAAWLDGNEQTARVLAIDDTESGASLSDSDLMRAGRVVLCEAWTGFTADKLSEARTLLLHQR